MKTGRPLKLTRELQEKLVSAIKGGVYRQVAAEWVGIDRSTLKRWMARGKAQRRGKFRAFRAALIEAEQQAEVAMTLQITTAAKSDWRAAMAFLERKHPERWGRRDHHQVDANVRSTVKVNADDAVEELTRLLAGRAADS